MLALAGLFFFVTLIPVTLVALIPAVVFRAQFRRRRALWTRRVEHVVPVAYRGSTVILETIGRVPTAVAAGSLVSFYVAVPALFVAPLSLAAFAHHPLDALAGVMGSLVMIASAIVACAILRPSREAVLGARVIAAVEIVFALAAAWLEWLPLALVAATHAAALLCAAFANQRGNVWKCA